jgi:radical SAM superfamily enzyme YgiQ (UPF0313 family)
MMDWLKKDIKMEQVLGCAERCKKFGIAVIFPFIVGFPDESEKSVYASLEMIKLLRSKSSAFQTPIFYFKPYPGSEITQQAVENGYDLPNDLESWSEFDYVDSKGGPWVSDQKYTLIENFKFYSNIAWRKKNRLAAPVKYLARWRCKKNYFRFPIEKIVSDKLFKKVELS